MILANRSKTKENNIKVESTEQADFSLLRLSIEKDFQKAASVAAHEIRNPLSAMELHSRVISKRIENIDEESLCSIKTSIGCILNSIEILKAITGELKDFSKETEINIQKLDITKVAKKTAEIIRPVFEEQNVNLVFHKSESIFCNFDENKTQQILFNLMKNALEATPEGGKVDVYFVEKSILVRDTGCGVLPEHTEKIFYPRFTTKSTGNGIGLYEARKIARAQKGDLKLVSTGKNGSIFELKLQ